MCVEAFFGLVQVQRGEVMDWSQLGSHSADQSAPYIDELKRRHLGKSCVSAWTAEELNGHRGPSVCSFLIQLSPQRLHARTDESANLKVSK